MNTSLNFLLTFLLFVSSITACVSGEYHSPVEHVSAIRLSINNNNIKKLRTLATLPLFFQEQEWSSATDGYGFVLGDSKQIELATNEEFEQHFRARIESIHIKGEKVLSNDITLDMFAEELKGTKKYWMSLNLYLLKRGEGDVEHIVLLGLDKNTNKLRAIYVN